MLIWYQKHTIENSKITQMFQKSVFIERALRIQTIIIPVQAMEKCWKYNTYTYSIYRYW